MQPAVMDIRRHCSRKHSASASSQPATKSQAIDCPATPTPKDKQTTKAEKKKKYKFRIGHKKEWEHNYLQVYCTDPAKRMFCRLCQVHGKAPPTAKGGRTSWGICDWNHATELLKLHNDATWHKDAARMAEQSASVGSVLDLYTAASAKQAEEQQLKTTPYFLSF